jgi:hypothetical protein
MLARICFVADALGRPGTPDRLDTATRMAMDSDFSDNGELAGPERDPAGNDRRYQRSCAESDARNVPGSSG